MSIRLLAGDCRDVLPTLPAESVQCVVTSPPYYGLRDYGTALWDGGDANCQHRSPTMREGRNEDRATLAGSVATNAAQLLLAARSACGKCGAVRVDRQIGLESTHEEYLATMVGVFREVRRVLRRDGTCWVNMGDSYAANAGNGNGGIHPGGDQWSGGSRDKRSGLKPKDLLLMPARLALALQADGWFIRSDVIWHKPNPMPESCTDRPTSAHEHVFLLTRSSRYYYDADAVREEAEYGRREWTNGRKSWDTLGQDHSGITGTSKGADASSGRNLRNVWTIATHAYPDAHFATFPPELAERCIKAGTSERGACSACGKPGGRQSEQTKSWRDDAETAEQSYGPGSGNRRIRSSNGGMSLSEYVTTGWSAGCQCGTTETRPCVVLDCFAGAGTSLLVADRLQRDAIGIELNVAYTEMAMERCRADAPLFTSFPPAEDPEEARMGDLFQDMAAD